MIYGMHTRVFQLKIERSALGMKLLTQEPSDTASCFCTADCIKNIKKREQNQTKKTTKTRSYQYGM